MMPHIPAEATREEPKTGGSEEWINNAQAEVWKCEYAGRWHRQVMLMEQQSALTEILALTVDTGG